jgi:glycosyltransferase involved in cell wall biosynthesis
MVRQLAKGAYQFHIICGNKDLDSTVLAIPVNQWVQYADNCRVWYSTDDDIIPILKNEMAKAPDALLYIVGVYDWQYNIKPMLFINAVKKIVSVRGMLHPGGLSQMAYKKKIFLFLFKLLGLQRKHFFHVSDDAEKGFVCRALGSKAKALIAGNFAIFFRAFPLPPKISGELKLISVGLVSPMKNYFIVLQALQAAGSSSSSADDLHIEYNIYGYIKDEMYWRQCRELIAQMPAGIVVNYHGAVEPSMIETALAANHVFILPSKSENFGHSIVEALSVGRPVITSDATPWNNFEITKAGLNVSTRDTQELVSAVELFAGMNQEQLEAWSNGARTYAEKAIDLDVVRKQYEFMFA